MRKHKVVHAQHFELIKTKIQTNQIYFNNKINYVNI